MSRAGRGANEESFTLQEPRSSKPGEEDGWGEEKGEKCKKGGIMGEGGDDTSSRGEDGEGRRPSMRKLSLTRRQSRDLLKKKISFEEQVLVVNGTCTGTGTHTHTGARSNYVLVHALLQRYCMQRLK